MTLKTLQKKMVAAQKKARSAWARGVHEYAHELVYNLFENHTKEEMRDILNSPSLFIKALLNGADDWKMYSWGGCSLIYNNEIAQRLCTPSELKIVRNGQRRPNASEEWLDTQARALYQAQRLLENIIFYSK